MEKEGRTPIAELRVTPLDPRRSRSSPARYSDAAPPPQKGDRRRRRKCPKCFETRDIVRKSTVSADDGRTDTVLALLQGHQNR
jgi:hypothetical protein